MRRRHFAALAIAIAVSSDRTETQSREALQRPQTSVPVSGVVVDASGAPVQRATVWLNEVRQPDIGRPAPNPYIEITDESGRFRFANVQPGRYSLESWSTGYPPVQYGATFVRRTGVPITVAADKPAEELTLTLRKGGAISGTVRDEFGDAVGASVFARSALGYASYGTTDQHGRYRLPYLPPGSYVVGVEAAATAAVTSLDSNGREYLVMVGPAWYGGGSSASDALPVRIAADSDISGIDMIARYVPAAPLSVTLHAPGAITVPQLELIAEGSAPRMPSSSKAWDGSTYRLDAVAAGRYVLVASGNVQSDGRTERLRGQVEVTLDGLAPTTIVVPLDRGAVLNGRAVFDLKNPATGYLDATLKAVNGGVSQSFSLGALGLDAPHRPDNAFAIRGIAPGEYVLRAPSLLGPHRWTLTSVIMDGQEVVDVPIRIAANSVTAVALTISDRSTELSGRVTDATGRPQSGLMLVVFSADKRHWYLSSTRIELVQPDARGEYLIGGLPPGDYWLAAITDGLDLPNGLVAGLTELSAAAIRISLALGEPKRQDLRTGRDPTP